MLARIAFWAGLSVPAYAYLLYPVVLVLLRRLVHRPVKKAPFEPFISLLIAAYNEAAMLAEKSRNCLALDSPPDHLEIVVACDGPRDGTTAIAKSFADGERVRVLDYKVNRGKIPVLNDGVKSLRGDIVVFSDAAALLNRDSVRTLVANFADPQVGAVSGKYVVVKAGEVER